MKKKQYKFKPEDIDSIRQEFFEFFAKLLKHYKSEELPENEKNAYETNNYKNDDFLKLYDSSKYKDEELGFLRVFTTTSLF